MRAARLGEDAARVCWSELSLEGTEEREKGLSPLLPQIRLPCQQYVTGISFPTLLLLQPCSTAAEDGDEV